MRIQNGKRQSFFLLFLTLMSSLVAIAQQAPTSLKYPSSVVAITNFSNVYLAPTVSGSVTTYSISPALPTGLSLAANTGIITGTPTVASPATTYTITAANASGSATTTLTLQVTTSYFDNAYGQLRFTGTPTAITGTTGMANGNRMLYRNVATISGTQIDCIITTVDQSNVQWEAYDQEAPTGTFYDSNNPNFFSPQFNFTAAGFVSFNFQFILGNSYNATTSPNGIPVTLQNVYINTYDIDGNGNARQYNSFSGFDSYQLGNPTIEQVTYDGTYASTRFTANNNTNFPTVIDPQTRVRTTYKNVSNFPIVVGANGGGTNPNGLAYFFFDFNSGSTFSTAVSTQAPSLDLNTSTTGVSNAGLNCGGAMNFTSGGTNFNAASPATTKLEVSFPIGDIKDGANEQFVIGTATRNLHENGNAATSVTIGGETWSITGTSSGSTRTLIFTPTGTASPARTEALLDVLQYRNSATAATNGTRNFTVNVFGGTMVSPDAVFSAEVNCVSISGNIYRDANGLSDNTVNANGTQLAINGAYAVLTNASNTVIASVGISAGGAYNFGTQSPGSYLIYIRNAAAAVGTTVNTATYPTSGGQSFISIGENFGAGTGTDGLTDGKIVLTVGSTSVTNANFGIELPPTTTSTVINNAVNPGGYNFYTIPTSGGFTYADQEDNTDINSITITSFPTNANYIRLNGIVYTNTSGSTCPPQSSCVAWPGSVIVPRSNISTIAIDPLATTGATSVTIPFRATDKANVSDVTATPNTLTVNFSAPAANTISGNVWNDLDNNGVKQALEAFTNKASAGQTLYALLVQTTGTYSGAPTVYTATPVTVPISPAIIGYSFSNVPSGNQYEIRLASLPAAPVNGVALSTINQTLADGWVGVSYNYNGAIPKVNTTAPVITLGTVAASVANVNFGIEALPTAQTNTATSQGNPGGMNTATVPATAFSGIDNDIVGGQINYVHITAFPTNATSVTIIGATTIGGVVNTVTYNSSSTFPVGGVYIATSPNGNLANASAIRVDPIDGAVTTSFTYKVVDNAGLASTATATASQPFTTLSISGMVYDDYNGLTDNQINGPIVNTGSALYVNAVSGGAVVKSAAVSASGSYNLVDMNAGTYNLVLATIGSSTTATVPSGWVNTGEGNGTISDGAVNGTLSVTLTNSNVTGQNFGIEALPIAQAKNYYLNPNNNTLVQKIELASTVNNTNKYMGQIGLTGTASSGSVPGLLTGVDPDGNNGAPVALSAATSGVSLVIDPATYSGTYFGAPAADVMMLMYNGIQLQPGGCRGTDIGNSNCTLYNSSTAKWEIPAYSQSQLQLLVKSGTSQFSFQYAWKDAAAATGSASSYFVQFATPLPLKLEAFTARADNNNQVKLNWHTLDEVNTHSFEIEYGRDGISFKKVGTMAAQGNAASATYNFLHQNPSKGHNYYRLKMIDQDGTFTYSPIRLVQLSTEAESGFTLTPNPAISGYAHIIWSGSTTEPVQVRVFDNNGKQILTSILKDTNLLRLETSKWPAGIYQVLLSQGGMMYSKKLSVQ